MPDLNPNRSKFALIICAAGSSSRMGGIKKEYCLLPGTDSTVLGAAFSAFSAFSCISKIVITVPLNGEAEARHALKLPSAGTPVSAGSLPDFISGGKTRHESVYKALLSLAADDPDYVLIHDGCRPWISTRLIQRIIEEVVLHQAVIPVLPMADTPKQVDVSYKNDLSAKRTITRHLRRDFLGLAQTPQAFAFPELLIAYEKANNRTGDDLLYEYTDDAEVWGEFCGSVAVVPGEPANRKITFPGDL